MERRPLASARVTPDGLSAAVEKMRAADVGEAAIETFSRYYERLQAGEQGLLPEAELEPVPELPAFDDLPDRVDREALDQAVVLKLNGGLGTGMGMTQAKSLLEVKDGLTFLDLIARQVLALRGATGARLPLLLMNSFATRDDSLALLARYADLPVDLPPDFVQNKVPKLRAGDLRPVEWPADPELEWAPPGHGDLYVALVTSGMLELLLERGYRYAFVSNSDNLGAVLEPRILSWMAAERIPFVMEAARRTASDRKGGHLALRGGGLLLREIAQAPQEDQGVFQDIGRHQFFNSNTLWIDLHALQAKLAEHSVLELPMIVNRKTVDPTDSGSPAVIQLETAMGAAIAVFEGARALHVPRRRFAPVKTTDQLLSLRSDAFVLHPDARVELAPERNDVPPNVELDSAHFRLVGQFDERFPAGAPSLIDCERLTVVGDVGFEGGVVVRGAVRLSNDGTERRIIPAGSVLEG